MFVYFNLYSLSNVITSICFIVVMFRFNERLAAAVTTNVAGTKSMLDLAREMTNLKVGLP